MLRKLLLIKNVLVVRRCVLAKTPEIKFILYWDVRSISDDICPFYVLCLPYLLHDYDTTLRFKATPSSVENDSYCSFTLLQHHRHWCNHKYVFTGHDID